MASSEEVKIVITAEDKASSVFDKLGGGSSKLASALKGLGAIAITSLVAAGAAVTSFAASSLKAFIEAEKEMAIATNTLQTTFNNLSEKEVKKLKVDLESTTVSLDQVKSAMEESSKAALKLGFDDEEAAVAFSKLFAVTKGVTSSQEELKIAMDLAAFSGRSLEEATQALVLVHAGGTRVLKEFGLDVKDNVSAAEALALVQDKVAGSAEAMANTTAGKLQILSNSWGNLKEQVGGALAQAITPFIEKLSVWAQDPATQAQFQQIADKVANLAAKLAPVVEKLIPAMVTGLKIAIGVLELLGDRFNATTEFLSALIFKVMQFVDWIKQLVENVKQAIQWLDQLAQKTVGGIKSGVSNTVGNIGNAIGGLFRASGGPVSAGSPYIVGEQGPELFVPGSSGSIVPNGGFGGGITVNITGTFMSEDAASAMANIMIDRLKLELRI